MTVGASAPARPAAGRRLHHGLLLAVVAGITALLLRPPSVGAWPVTVAAGLVGALAPLPRTEGLRPMPWAAVAALGTLPFLAFAAWSPSPGVAGGAALVAAALVAAVAEELFFRRLVYGWLARWGAAVAVVGAAVAFAVVHVPVHGWAVVPIDLAAGLVLGWQRWASGGWTAAAVTHAVANVLVIGGLP